MPTAKELGIKPGDIVKLTDKETKAIMSSFGVFLGVPAESMMGRGWMCFEAGDGSYSFNPLDHDRKPIDTFTWKFSENEDAFQPQAKKGARS